MAASPYTNLYFSTDALVKKFKPSLSNTFDVYVAQNFGRVLNSSINFLAYEAVLPGTSYELGQVYGDRMGRTEQYPTKKVYPPVDVSFYIDQNYEVLEYFEAWMNSISKNYGSRADSYVRHNYASEYETEVIITKFERQFREKDQRLVKAGVYGPPKKAVRYTLRNAFPSNLISVPVSYEGANVLRTTVTFNYDVYNFDNNGFETDGGVEENGDRTGTVSGPGSDPSTITPRSASELANTDGSILSRLADQSVTGQPSVVQAEYPNGYPQPAPPLR